MTKLRSSLIFFLSFLSLAPQGRSFVHINPTLAEYTTGPGGRVQGAFTVTNPSEKDMNVSVEIQEWWGRQTGLPALEPKAWLKVKAPPTFVLKPKAQRVIPYKGRIPKGWTGGAAAMILFNMTALREGAPLAIQYKHGVPIYVYSRGGDDRVSLSIEALSVSAQADGTLVFTAKVANGGTVHLRPRGEVVLLRAGEKLAAFPLEWGSPVFPNHTQDFTARGKLPVQAAGAYVARVSLGYEVVFLPAGSAQRDFTVVLGEDGSAAVAP